RRHELRPGDKRVTVLLEFKNSKEANDGLGVPLPRGPVRVFQNDGAGEPEFLGSEGIDHTPRDEKVRLRLGYAFDLAAQRKTLAVRKGKGFEEFDLEIRVRNHKKEKVTVDVIETVEPRTNWTMVKKSLPYEKRDVNTLVFPLTLPADTEGVLTYTVRYDR